MRYFRKALGFDDFRLMLFGMPIVALIVASILFNETLSTLSPLFFSRCIFVSFFYVCLYWLTFRVVFVFFRIRFPDHQDVVRRLVYQSGLIFVVYLLLRTILKLSIHDWLHEFAGVLENKANMTLEPVSTLILTLMVLAVYEGVYFFNLLNQSILEKEQLQKAHIQSQLQGLRSQVNPHFLFNSLNTLAHLIPEDSGKAIRFVQKLAKTYRYILEIRDERLIRLSEELDFLNSFIFLFKERFGENLKVDIQIDPKNLQDLVFPLSLQLLVENAIKHNIISKSKPLYIQIFIEKEKYIVVQNNLQIKNQVINSTNIGLENIKKRYTFYAEEEVKVTITEDHFKVALPLIHSTKILS